MASLEEKIENGTARVAVVGVGYVGEPLSMRIMDAGFPVVGIDKYADPSRVSELSSAGLEVTDEFGAVALCDVVVICVPTPLGEGQQPDTSFVEEAARDIAASFGDGEKLVVLESTSYPGTTRELVLPLLEEQGIRLGQRLCLAYSPERVDPGSGRDYREIPRIVGGLDERSARLAEAFYRRLVGDVWLVSCPEAAEMAKLLENIFRAVNIALVNEMSLLCRRDRKSVV